MSNANELYSSTLPNGASWTASNAGHLAAWTQWREASARALRTGEGVMLKTDERGHVYIEMVYSPLYFRAAWDVSPDGKVGYVGEQGDGDATEAKLRDPAGLPWATVA